MYFKRILANFFRISDNLAVPSVHFFSLDKKAVFRLRRIYFFCEVYHGGSDLCR